MTIEIGPLFPACAGMNRVPSTSHSSILSVPRVRGDEPNDPAVENATPDCSPRARG